MQSISRNLGYRVLSNILVLSYKATKDQMDIEKRLNELLDRNGTLQESIYDLFSQLRWMKSQMEDLISTVQYTIAHTLIVDYCLDVIK